MAARGVQRLLGTHPASLPPDCAALAVSGYCCCPAPPRPAPRRAAPQGDADTVNCLEPHPHHLLTVATSGIEDTIKLWAPSAEEPQARGAGAEGRGGARAPARRRLWGWGPGRLHTCAGWPACLPRTALGHMPPGLL